MSSEENSGKSPVAQTSLTQHAPDTQLASVATGAAETQPSSPRRSANQTLLSAIVAQSSPRARRAAEASSESSPVATSQLERFVTCEDLVSQLRLWFGEGLLERKIDREWLVAQLQRDIAKIDRLLESQVNAILHHAGFQRLEAAWRGLQYLVDSKGNHSGSPIVIKVLNVSWLELRSDLEGASEFDQSQIFRKVYEEGLGTPGADPFSALIADFAVHPRPSREHPVDDMFILRGLSQIAAAAFCPLIINASPAMFAVDEFTDLKHAVNLDSLHAELDFFAWQRFRETEDSRFISLALPRILMRLPYRDTYEVGFPYEERITTSRDYLWGGAAFAMGEVLMRSFADGRWFANIRGAQRGVEGGGLVHGPVSDRFTTEPQANAVKPLTDLVVADDFERELARTGFLPLCACKDMPLAAFYSCATAQKPRSYNTPEATANAKLSSLLNYMLCVSRFGHYLKVISREKIGSCNSPEELERILQNWIVDYVTPDTEASQRVRSEKPLRAAEINIRSLPGRAGEYGCIIHIAPHHELDDIQASVRLDTRLIQPVRK